MDPNQQDPNAPPVDPNAPAPGPQSSDEMRQHLIEAHGFDPEQVKKMDDQMAEHCCQKMAEATADEPGPDLDEVGQMAHYAERVKKYAGAGMKRFGQKFAEHMGTQDLFAENEDHSVKTSTDTAGLDELKAGNFSEKFSESVTKLVDAIVTKRIGEIDAKAKGALKQFNDRVAQERKKDIDLFCEELVRDGKVLPAEVDSKSTRPTLRTDLEAADNATPIFTYSENGKEIKLTAYERLKQQLRNRPAVNRAEKLKGRPAGSEAESEELAKVERFAESPEASFALECMNKTPQKYVEEFREIAKKKRGYTAAQYGVPESV